MKTPQYTCTRDDLKALAHRHPTFVGVDSDGCVFDTMEIKQKQCFHGQIISHWGLEPVAPLLRECAEFVNLYSRWRGQNRFTALLMTFDLLRARPDARAVGTRIPELPGLRKLVASGRPLGNPTLARAAQTSADKDLVSVLQWSMDVNRQVESIVKGIPPFKWVRESLAKIGSHSDVICVSQTPGDALLREWEEHGLTGYVSMIAAQELGTKSEHISLATRSRYAPGKVLIIGDGPGDMKAATDNGALFYPVNPGQEEGSWERLYVEAYDTFLAGDYAGAYQDGLVAEFEALLPETPPWTVERPPDD